jgi:hypothetical protein
MLGIIHYVRGMDKALARQTGNVRARAAEPAALDDSATLTGFGRKCPRDKFPRFATTEDKEVVVVWVRL